MLLGLTTWRKCALLWVIIWSVACTPGTPPVEPAPVTAPAPPPEPVFAEPTEPKYAASHVLVAWAGATRAPDTVTRSREEARSEAGSIHALALGGADFARLAREHSDGPSAQRGGALGVYLTGTMVPQFEAAAASVAVGKIAPVVETPFGFHVIRRDAVVQIRASHVLVSWNGAWRSAATRTREEAALRIREARRRLVEGAAFAEVAATYSDDATATHRGDLGPISPGQMIPAFEEAAMALESGALSEVVETPYGFHLILRTE